MARVLPAVVALLGLWGLQVGTSNEALAALQYEPQTTESGTRFILVSGQFDADEPLEGFITLVGTHKPSFVTFQSPGGNVGSAMRLGRMIRGLGLSTIQIRALECSSACSLAFLGGVWRGADSGAIGVHQSSFGDTSGMDTKTAVDAIQAGTAMIIGYISEMGADPALLQVALQYSSNDMRYLSSSEMAQFRVVTAGQQGIAQTAAAAASPAVAAPAPPPMAQPQTASAQSNLVIPDAHSGRVRHPKGQVFLRTAPNDKGANLVALNNGSPVTITGNDGRWYRVQTGAGQGYLHDTWVLVDQFESGPFEARHIQVKSFDNFADAQAFVRSSPSLKLSAYLATNGWFAVTLKETYDKETGTNVLKYLKANRAVPDDAYLSYGNTYARRVCCDR